VSEKEYLVIEPAKFEKLLRMVSLPKASKALLEPVEFHFDENGLWVRQYDNANIVAVIANFRPGYFQEYNIMPSFQVSASSILPDLRKVLKLDRAIKIFLTEDKIFFKGELEEYSDLRPNIAVYSIEPDKIVERPFGFCSSRLNPHKIYRLDVGQLELMKAEEISFEYGDVLTAEIASETKSYRRRLVHEANPAGEGSGRVTLYYDILQRVVKNLSGMVYMVFTEEGPVIFSQKTDVYSLTYVIAPREEE